MTINIASKEQSAKHLNKLTVNLINNILLDDNTKPKSKSELTLYLACELANNDLYVFQNSEVDSIIEIVDDNGCTLLAIDTNRKNPKYKISYFIHKGSTWKTDFSLLVDEVFKALRIRYENTL